MKLLRSSTWATIYHSGEVVAILIAHDIVYYMVFGVGIWSAKRIRMEARVKEMEPSHNGNGLKQRTTTKLLIATLLPIHEGARVLNV